MIKKRVEPTDETNGLVSITPISPQETSKEPKSPRRPTTRSLTTTVMVTVHEDRGHESHNQANAQPSSSKQTLDLNLMEVAKQALELSDAARRAERDIGETNSSTEFNSALPLQHIPPPLHQAKILAGPNQYTFLETYTSGPHSERRGPRTRTAPPIPVPNLTKKSRGRRVPTKPQPVQAKEKDAVPRESREGGVQKSGRVYVCKVEDCGKCFSRGEHLKRHIRSIHTHEKRGHPALLSRTCILMILAIAFKCGFPSCDKFFNRHDNLLQHQKVHKDSVIAPSQLSRLHTNDTYSPLQRPPHFAQAPNSSPEENLNHSQTPPPYAHTIFPSYPLSGSVGYGTNMAVSSLRTELSPSQVQVENAHHPPKESGSLYPTAAYDPQLMADSAASTQSQTTIANFSPAREDSVVSDEEKLDELVSIKSP